MEEHRGINRAILIRSRCRARNICPRNSIRRRLPLYRSVRAGQCQCHASALADCRWRNAGSAGAWRRKNSYSNSYRRNRIAGNLSAGAGYRVNCGSIRCNGNCLSDKVSWIPCESRCSCSAAAVSVKDSVQRRLLTDADLCGCCSSGEVKVRRRSGSCKRGYRRPDSHAVGSAHTLA